VLRASAMLTGHRDLGIATWASRPGHRDLASAPRRRVSGGLPACLNAPPGSSHLSSS